MVRIACVFFAAALLTIGCAPALRSDRRASYAVSVVYTNRTFTNDEFAGQSILVLPVLTDHGPSASASMSAQSQTALLRNIRNDLQVIPPEIFEKTYLSTNSRQSLAGFYRDLFGGNVIAAETSDSVWKAISAAYLFTVKLRYAAAVRGFDGNTHKHLSMEAELWKVAEAEAVWRAELNGDDKGSGQSDAEFVAGAFSALFFKFPGVSSLDDEKDW